MVNSLSGLSRKSLGSNLLMCCLFSVPGKWGRPSKGSDSFYQARKKSIKINFLGPETARWGGGLPLEGVVAENFVPALESLSSLGFDERNLGCPGNFAGMSRTPAGVQKVCAKKLRAHFSFPILARFHGSFGCSRWCPLMK